MYNSVRHIGNLGFGITCVLAVSSYANEDIILTVIGACGVILGIILKIVYRKKKKEKVA